MLPVFYVESPRIQYQSTDSIHGVEESLNQVAACLRDCHSAKENDQSLNIKHFTYIDCRVHLLPHLAEPVFHEELSRYQFQNPDSLAIHGAEIESLNQVGAA